MTGITRSGIDKVTTSGRGEAPFVVTSEGPYGLERTTARAVIDATGTWLTPNPVGAWTARDRRTQRCRSDRARHPRCPGRDRRRYAKRRIAVVGSGHSAQNAVRDLAVLAERTPGTEVTWIVRRSNPAQMLGGKANDQLVERGRLGADAQQVVDNGAVQLVTGFRTDRISQGPDGVSLVALDGREVGPFDRIVNATGFRPDLSIESELRVDVDPVLHSARALAPMIDPNVHSCGSVPPHGAAELTHPEPGFYIVGAKSYGRAPTFLLATGYEQVRSVVAELAGDHTAANDVQLILPDTGVCSLDRSLTAAAATPGPSDLVTVPDAAGACCN